jgi:hypothetical protein
MQAPFWDNSRDNHFSSIDVLIAINELNRLFDEGEQSAAGEGEAWTSRVEDYFAAEHLTANNPSVRSSNLTSPTPAIKVAEVEIVFTDHDLITRSQHSTLATLQRDPTEQNELTDIQQLTATTVLLGENPLLKFVDA